MVACLCGIANRIWWIYLADSLSVYSCPKLVDQSQSTVEITMTSCARA